MCRIPVDAWAPEKLPFEQREDCKEFRPVLLDSDHPALQAAVSAFSEIIDEYVEQKIDYEELDRRRKILVATAKTHRSKRPSKKKEEKMKGTKRPQKSHYDAAATRGGSPSPKGKRKGFLKDRVR